MRSERRGDRLTAFEPGPGAAQTSLLLGTALDASGREDQRLAALRRGEYQPVRQQQPSAVELHPAAAVSHSEDAELPARHEPQLQ